MREVAFIKQNKDKWIDFEFAMNGRTKQSPDHLASLYLQLVNDLSFAQSYYPKSKTTQYLNNLAAIAYHKIYKTKQEDQNRVVHFFKIEVPLLVYYYRRYLVYAFVLFFLAVSIGVLSAKFDESFVRLILGDAYVNMTLENINSGDAVAVYKSGSNWGSFVGISFNNLQVGLRCFIYGIFGGFGTGYILLQNGIMLGAFQYFFHQQGVLWESVRGVWIHGAMEIFAIVIESMAGLILGASLLFPGTFSRLDSFKKGLKVSLKIFLSTIPFTIAAGFLEGFLTRYALQMPVILNLILILGTLFIISYYYLVYPAKVALVHQKEIKEKV